LKPVRRLVTVDDANGRSRALADGPAPSVHTDPARPGYSSTLIWYTNQTPARVDTAPLHAPYRENPSPGGSVCRVVCFPPEKTSLVETGEPLTSVWCSKAKSRSC
jgi:hypothetical protein